MSLCVNNSLIPVLPSDLLGLTLQYLGPHSEDSNKIGQISQIFNGMVQKTKDLNERQYFTHFEGDSFFSQKWEESITPFMERSHTAKERAFLGFLNSYITVNQNLLPPTEQNKFQSKRYINATQEWSADKMSSIGATIEQNKSAEYNYFITLLRQNCPAAEQSPDAPLEKLIPAIKAHYDAITVNTPLKWINSLSVVSPKALDFVVGRGLFLQCLIFRAIQTNSLEFIIALQRHPNLIPNGISLNYLAIAIQKNLLVMTEKLLEGSNAINLNVNPKFRFLFPSEEMAQVLLSKMDIPMHFTSRFETFAVICTLYLAYTIAINTLFFDLPDMLGTWDPMIRSSFIYIPMAFYITTPISTTTEIKFLSNCINEKISITAQKIKNKVSLPFQWLKARVNHAINASMEVLARGINISA